MNKIPALACALSASLHIAVGQGTIDVGNAGTGFVQPIFNQNDAFPVGEQVGNPSTSVYNGAIPTGTTVFGGTPLVGTGYDMVFFYSLNNSVTSVGQMSVGTITPFRTAAIATAAPAGTISTILNLPIPGTTGGTPIAFAFGSFVLDPAIAAYEVGHPGTPPSQIWAVALADFNTGDVNADIGYGSIVSGVPLGGFDTAGVFHNEANTFGGWMSFSLYPTPEPSTFAMLGFGGGLLLLGRRFIAGLRPTQRSNKPDR